MAKEFFTLSELALKLRRNVLFVSVLCFTHFAVVSLSTLKVFNVSIPDKFLNIGLPTCLIWFALNYFYILYAEYTQWKSSFIEEVDVPEGMTEKSWKTRTLIPEIRQLTNSSIQVHAEFTIAKGYSPGRPVTVEGTNADTEELLINIENNVMSAIKTDVARIVSFQRAIKRYNMANQLRFYILDSAVPSITVLTAILASFSFFKF